MRPSRHFLFCILLLFTVSYPSFSQDISNNIGQVSQAELQMDKFTNDPSANAYVLFDIGSARFSDNYSGGLDITFERSTRIKIFNEQGYEYANVSIPLYQQNNIYERVTQLEAFTYNLNGQLIERTVLDPKTIAFDKKNESIMLEKFALPNVKAGSVIEYHYTMVTPYLFNLPDWNFQWRIPVRYSEYDTYMVPFYEYQFVIQGASKLDLYDNHEDHGTTRQFGAINYNDNVYRFGMRNVPAFREEPYFTTEDDYIMKIIFQLTRINRPDGAKIDYVSTWDQLIKELLKSETFGKFGKGSNSYSKSIIASLSLEGKSQEDQLAIITRYVKKNYKWNEYDRMFTDKSPRKFQDEKAGNSACINLFLVSLLNAAGIEANPLLLSTRDHGAIRLNYPFLNAFNYVISAAKIDGKYYLGDATDIYNSIHNIPRQCLNNKGLLVKKEGPVEWVPLNQQPPSVIEEKLDIRFGDKALTTRLAVKGTNYDAYDMIRAYNDKPEALENNYLGKGYKSVDSIVLPKLENETDSFNYSLDVHVPFDASANLVYFAPFLNEPPSTNPFKLIDRTYPVDFGYLQRRDYSTVIHIPLGYSVQSLPDKLLYDNGDYYVRYNAEVKDNLVLIRASYLFRKPSYEPKTYKAIRFIMQDIVKKFNEQVVFKKS